MNYGNTFHIHMVLMFNLMSIYYGEYRVYYDKVPSYLFSVLDDIKYDFFPENLIINISLSKMGGTLLYSVDSNGNQLIVSLSDAIPATLVIEYNGKSSFLSLPKICGCDRCLFEILLLRIQKSQSSINFNCNDGDTNLLDYRDNKGFNKGYPMPYNRSEIIMTRKPQAHLWLVNTPQYKNVYPNSDQLAGCIFNVSYNNREIIFTSITDNIGRFCTKTCIGDICNGGQCHETYNGAPLCNCTMTFKNGDYCNDSVGAINKQSTSKQFMFELFKLSWNGSMTDMMRLRNKDTVIRVYVKKKQLVLEYENRDVASMTGVLMKNYKKNEKYILIAQFKDSLIDVKLYNNGIWRHVIMRIEKDLTNAVFDTLTLRSGDGVIDMASKHSPREFRWKSIKLRSGIQLGEVNKDTKQDKEVRIESAVTVGTVTGSFYTSKGIYILFAACALVLFVAAIFIGIHLGSRRKQRWYKSLGCYANDNTVMRLIRWMLSSPDIDLSRKHKSTRRSSGDEREALMTVLDMRSDNSDSKTHNRKEKNTTDVSTRVRKSSVSKSNIESAPLVTNSGSGNDSGCSSVTSNVRSADKEEDSL